MSYPWPSDLHRKEQSATGQLSAPRLQFEILESRILLSAEIGIPPSDPLADDFLKDRFTTLESQYLDARQLPDVVLEAEEPAVVSPLPQRHSFNSADGTQEIPIEWVLPASPLLQPDTEGVPVLMDTGQNWLANEHREELAETVDGVLARTLSEFVSAGLAADSAISDSGKVTPTLPDVASDPEWVFGYGRADFIPDRPDKTPLDDADGGVGLTASPDALDLGTVTGPDDRFLPAMRAAAGGNLVDDSERIRVENFNSVGVNPGPDFPLEWVAPFRPFVLYDTEFTSESPDGVLRGRLGNEHRGDPAGAGENGQGRADLFAQLTGALSEIGSPVLNRISPAPPELDTGTPVKSGNCWADYIPDRPDKIPSGSDDGGGPTISPDELDLDKNRPVIFQAVLPPPDADGVIAGTDQDDEFGNSSFDNEYQGLAGDDVYEFIDGWGDDTVTEISGEGTDTVDFSAVTTALTFTMNADGTIDVTDGTNTASVSANVENIIGGQGNDEFVFVDGAQFDGSIDGGGGADSLDLSAVTANGIYRVSNIETVTGGAGIDSLIVDGGGATLTASTSSSLTFANPANTITHSGLENVQVENSVVDLTNDDLSKISEGLQALTDRMGELDTIAGFDASIPLADPFGATFGDLVDFGHVMQQLVDKFDSQFLGRQTATNEEVTSFLIEWFADLPAPDSSESISGTISWAANILSASDFVQVDGGGIATLRFAQQLSSGRVSEFDLNLSDALRDQSVTVARGTLFDFLSGFELDYTFGLTDILSDPDAVEFFVDETLDLTATGGLAGGTVNILADALIGFVDGSVDVQLNDLSAITQVSLGASGGSWTLTDLEPGSDPFDISSEVGTIDISLDFDTGAGFDAGVADIADGLIDLASANFLTEDLVVTLPGSSDDFTLITPNELLRMLDQLGAWLSGLAQSEILNLNIPFAGETTIGDLLDFGEAFGEELLRHLVHRDGLRLSPDLLTDGRLIDAAGNIIGNPVHFLLEIETAAGTQAYDIELDPVVTDLNGSADDLRADIEDALLSSVGTALAAEIEVFLEDGRIGFRPIGDVSSVTGVSLPSVGNETLGFAGSNLTVPTSIYESGVLGHELEFTLNVDGTEHVITVVRDSGNTAIDDLVDDINSALEAEFGLDVNGAPNISVMLDPSTTRQLAFQLSPDAMHPDDTTIGSVILIDVRESSSLVEGLLNLGIETASFISAQDLADQLSDILSDIVGGITVNFDIANSEMSFTVDLARTFDIASLPLDVSVDLGDFIELESSADLGVTANAGLKFTFGVDLDPSESLVVAPPVSVPELPDLGQLLEEASFDFRLMQENFPASERLSGGTLNVGDWSITANGSTQTVAWTASTTGRLFHLTEDGPDADNDPDEVPDADHHFFIEVTDDNGEVTFVDAVLLSYDTEENESVSDLATNLETTIIIALASRGFDGLQVSLSNVTESGFQISASGSGFDGYQLRLVTEEEFEVAEITDVSVPTTVTDDNATLDDLLEDLQNAISVATDLANLDHIDDTLLGLNEVTSIGNQFPVIGDTAVPENGVLTRDVYFEIDIGGTLYKGVVRADSTLDNEQESENEPDPIESLAADVQAAINAAIAGSGETFIVKASAEQRLQFQVTTNSNVELHFFTPAVIADFTGQRFGVYAVPVLVQPDANNPGKLLTRRIVVETEFDDSAFENLGLSSSPIPSDGILTSTATFQIIVDDVSHTITVDPNNSNASVGDLVDDINAALEAAIGNTDVQARRITFSEDSPSDGNRIEFFTADNSGIQSLVLPALQPDASNAAIEQLGFSIDEDYSARIQSGEFFIRDASLTGGLNLDATDIDASAVVGLGGDDGVGIGVEVTDSSGGVFGDVVITLVNPNDGSSQISLGDLWDYLGSSDLDLTELVDADITGGVAIDLDVAPVLPIRTPIDPAHIDIDLELTDWLNNPPSLTDASLGNGLSVNVSGLDLNIYDALSNLTFSDVVDALQQVVDFLRDLQGDGAGTGGLAAILDEPLPLLNQSPSELLLVADHFAALVDEVIANPAESLGKLESMLEDLLGVPDELVTLALDFDDDDSLALRVDLQFSAGLQESFGFDLDIKSLVDLTASDSLARTALEGVTGLVGVSSTGDLSVGVDGTLRLSFGIALGNGNGSAEALGFRDGATSNGGVLTASGDAQAAADRLVDQDVEFELLVDGASYFVTVTAGDQTSDPVEVDPTTLLSELKDAPDLNDLPDSPDISVTLRDATKVDIDLNPLGNDPTIAEVVVLINDASPNLSAVFSQDLQRILIEDTSTPSADSEQSGVYVTQTGVGVYAQTGDDDFNALAFSLQVGTNNDPVPVSVDAMSDVTRKEWLAAIDEAIRKAMVDAGQLNPVAAAVVDVAYNGSVNGGQLTFQGTGDGFGERLTIYRGGTFSVSDIDSSDVADQLGLKGSDDNGDRIIIGSELRKDAEADEEGLVADVQRAINEAMDLDQDTQVVTVSLLPSEGGGVGRLELTTNPASELEIRSITQALAPFLYNGANGTALILGAGASGDNLEFTAQVGPFGFFVIDGSADLDANFLVTLEDTGDADGRTYFGEDEFAVETSYGGSAVAELPLFFPTEATPVNDQDNTLDIGISDLLAFLNGESGSVEISTPDLTAFPTPTLIGMLSNPEFLIDGLDSVLLSIQDALDGEIYGIDMPLIGDGLAPAGQFIADFREDVLAYLSLKLREGGLNPVTLVQETLYNIFGGEDDGDPAAVRVLGFEPDAEATGSLVATTVLGSGTLDRDAEINITVGNDDTTRVVVFAEDVADDTPEALLQAINDALEGRGLADSLTAGFVTEPGGGFRLTFTATDAADKILIETAGAIQLDLFGLSVGALDFLQDATDDNIIDINDILKTGFGLFDEFGQFDVLLGQSTVFGQSLDFDIGLDILDFDLDAGVEVEFGWELGFGFGVSQDDGFYFVADSALAPESILNPGESGELIISLDVSLLGVLGFSPGTGSDIDLADGPVELTATAELPADGKLSGDVVFALDVGGTLVDEITIFANDTSSNGDTVDLVANIENAINAALVREDLDPDLVTAESVLDADGNPTGALRLVAASGTGLVIYDSATAVGRLGFLQVRAVDGGREALGQVSSDYSGLGLEIVVDIRDPGSGSNQDGRLSFAEMSSSSTQLSDIIVAEATGAATVNLGLTVDFASLGLDSAILPAIGTDLEIDWEVGFSTETGATIATPDVVFKQIELDLGSFVSELAGPFLEDMGAFIEPLGFLLDPQDGLLYQRLPVISDLAGETVTLKQLAELLDTEDKITPFLNALEQIYFLVDLVSEVAEDAADNGGDLIINFGDIMLSGGDLDTLQNDGSSLADWNLEDNPLTPTNGSGSIDDFNRDPSRQGATQSFTRNVTRPGPGSVTFNILQAGTIVELLLGKSDVTLIEYDLPPFGFNFEYLQRFPIYPPLFATLRGFFSASIDLGFGYDTLGLNQFLASENPLDLVNGFFLTDLDADGFDIPEVTLYGGIAAGASLDVAVASAGVEGGIDATIFFNLNDPDQDAKVRLSEMLGNILLNYFNPIAVFDTSGKIDAFLRAYVEVLFGLWSAEYEIARVTLASFDIPFIRAPILAQDIGDGVLQLNMGTASQNRIHGPLADTSESLWVRYDANGSVYVRSSDGGAEQRYSGVTEIFVNAGAGDDEINFENFENSTIRIEIHGGTGNDRITGAVNGDTVIFGDEGDDTINLERTTNSDIEIEIHGGAGNDTIRGAQGSGNLLFGDAGDDRIYGGDLADDIEGGDGDDIIDGGAGNDIYRFSGNWGEDEIVEDTNLAGGSSDTWDFSGTTTDIDFSLGDDLRVGVVESAVLQGNTLRVTSTRHGLSTGDQVNLSGIGGATDLDGNPVDLPISVVVSVDPGDLDSFTVTLSDPPAALDYQQGTGIYQLGRTMLEIDTGDMLDVQNVAGDDIGGDVLIQIETEFRHGLRDGDVVTVGHTDSDSGQVSFTGQQFTVSVVDDQTFNLDGTDFNNPTFTFDNVVVQRQGIVNSDESGDEMLIQIETRLRHGLQDGDVVTLGHIDPVSGEATLTDQQFTVTVVNDWTINLDDTDYNDPQFAFEYAFIQRQESSTGLVENIGIDANVVTITSTNHGLTDGDEIKIFGSSTGDPAVGIPLNNTFGVTVIDENSFTIAGSNLGALIDAELDPAAIDVASAVWQLTRTHADSLGNSVTLNGFGIENIVGGRGGDVFDIYQTAEQEIVLDGAGGSDTYRAFAALSRVASGSSTQTRLFDTGDFWDTDLALFFGSESDDVLNVDNANIVTVLDASGTDNPTFSYGEPNIVVGFRSGSTGTNTLVAGDSLPSGQLDRDARFLLTVGDADPVLIVVEPDDVGGNGTVVDLVDAINAAIEASDLVGMVAATEDTSSGDSRIVFNAVRLDTTIDMALSIENLSQGSGIEAVEITSLGGDDEISIGGTNSRTAVNVSGGLGDDLIMVGGSDDGTGSLVTVNGIRGSALTGPLIIAGDEGVNSLVVTDADDDTDNTGSLTDSFVSGLGMQIDIEYSDISFVSVQMGSGSDVFVVENTIDGASLVLGGSGDDDIDVESATGVVNIDGEGGSDAILLSTSDSGSVVSIAGGSETDDIDVRSMEGDVFVRGDAGNDIIEIGTTAGLGAPGLLSLVNGRLDISGGSGIDTLIVDDSADGSLSMLARSPLSSLASASGRLSGDASFDLDFGNGDVVQISVAADVGVLSAADAIDATVLASGQITADAFFVLTVGGETYEVTVEQDTGNQTASDLLDDVNAALELVGLDPIRVTARLEGDTLVLDSLQGEDLHLELQAGDTAETELSFADGTDALFDNNSAADLEADINAAMAAAGVDGRVSASIDPTDERLSLTLLSGDYLRVVLDGNDPASVDLGLASNQLIQPDNVGTLRVNQTSGRAELVGLGMGAAGDGDPGITYDSVANVFIALGSGHDEFNVQGTLNDEAPAIQSQTTLSTGDGDDVINVSDTAPSVEADRGHLNGTLDSLQGELSILAGDGHNTLSISDRESTAADTSVVITSNRIEGLAAGAINYTATSGFAGGVTIWAGDGSDTVEIRSARSGDVTTFHANGGDDRITITDADAAVTDGLLIIEGGVGDDYIDASRWISSLFIFGDLGEVEYLDRTRSLDQITNASTIQIELGGSDQLFGSSANDFLLGGTRGDTISGGLGDDAVIGDGGRVSFINGEVAQIGSIDFFVGESDVLAGGQIRDDANNGGDGNDVIIGGAGFDVLYGTLAEDILIFEYGRVTYEDGFANTVVVLGQRPLDLAASTLFNLYLKDPFVVSPYHVGDVVSDRPPVEASFVSVSTGGGGYRSAYHEALCASYLAEVAFESGSAALTIGSHDYLREAADVLARFEGIVVHIRGHADSVGPADVNQKLSQERAESVTRALVSYGVDADLLRATGHGEEMPIGDNTTEQGRAENRRVEIELNSGASCDAPEIVDNEGAGTIGLLALAGWRSNRQLQGQEHNQCINW